MDRSPELTPRLFRASFATGILPDNRMFMALNAGVICALLLFSMPALAQSTESVVPENASAKSYSDGWECNVGFRIGDDACIAIDLPENAYENGRTYGRGWDCLHGYRSGDGATCDAVAVPEGGFLDPSGENWRCLRGFAKAGETCLEIVVPANAYLTDTTYGSAWKCERGFDEQGALCVAIAVPANAYLNTAGYGQPWKCERGYFEKNGLCAAVAVPENAYFDAETYGRGWNCERGYAVSDSNCEAIDIPASAHLDRSGNRWECNKNFHRSKGLCVLNN